MRRRVLEEVLPLEARDLIPRIVSSSYRIEGMQLLRKANAVIFVKTVGNELLAKYRAQIDALNKERYDLIDLDPEITNLKEDLATSHRPYYDPWNDHLRRQLAQRERQLTADVDARIAQVEKDVESLRYRLVNREFIERTILPLALREMERFNVMEVREMPIKVVNALTTTIQRALER
jgi:hypothetical protein